MKSQSHINLSKKVRTLVFTALLFLSISSNAQQGTATDFTLPAFGTGQSIHLFSYLNSGKVVIIDFFEYQCGPCWSYHKYHILNQFYAQHGPNGDNTAMVIQICTFSDADSSKLMGQNGGNWNWLASVDYPTIILPNTQIKNTILNGYGAWGTPTIVKICPNKNYWESYPLTSDGSAPAADYTLTGLNTWKSNTCGVTSIESHITQNDIKIYPNPANQMMTINGLENLKYNFKLINIVGQTVINIQNNTSKMIDVSNLTEGIYFATFEINNQIITKKIFIKH